jgi:WD40 repeat protein
VGHFFPNEPYAADETAEPDVETLIKQLGDDAFVKREAASQQLRQIGEPALRALRQALKSTGDAEVRVRARQLIGEIEKRLYGPRGKFGPHRGSAVNWATRVVVTPDGKQIVSAGHDGLRVWDVATGRQLRQLGEAKEGYWSLAISPDGLRIIAGCNDTAVRIWQLKSGKRLHELKGHAAEVWGVSFSPDSKLAVSGAWDAKIRIWDLGTGKLAKSIAAGSKIRSVAFSPKGDRIVTSQFVADGVPATVVIWDARTGKMRHTMKGHTDVVTSAVFSPDGKHVLSASFDRTIRLWDASSGKQLAKFTGHSHRVEGAAFSADGRRVVSSSEAPDATLRVWDAKSGEQIWQSDRQRDGLLGIAVLPDGKHVATTGKDGYVRLWLPKW